jgi:hypothetical protein
MQVFMGGLMPAVFLRKTAMRLLIVLTFLACWITSDAMAACSNNWTFRTVCSNSTDPKGSYCDNASCHCGPRFDETPTSYTLRCANPGWGCQSPNWAWYCNCQLGISTDEIWTLVDSGTGQPCDCVDGQVNACDSAGCPGIQTCSKGQWGTCQSTDPCCGDCDECCRQSNGGNGNNTATQNSSVGH